MNRRALITGITGQDGSYLTELLLAKGYEVHGLVRRRADARMDNLQHLLSRITIHHGDVTDQTSIDMAVTETKPDELYHLGAQSFVAASFNTAETTVDITGMGTVRVLESVKRCCPSARVYVAGSSEQFGLAPSPQSEKSPFIPQSPYACAKVLSHHMSSLYRRAYGMHVSVGILGNHESPRRGPEFVTRKITKAIAAIRAGHAEHITLGNMDASRDWGHAKDYVRAMWMMLQQEYPNDYVIGTGETHTVREFVECALKAAEFVGGPEQWVRLDPQFLRPAEVPILKLDASHARYVLGWKPECSFEELVRDMVTSDLRSA